jgi:hypothetical protein
MYLVFLPWTFSDMKRDQAPREINTFEEQYPHDIVPERIRNWVSLIQEEYRDMAAILECLDWSWVDSMACGEMKSPDAILRYKIFMLCKFAFRDLQPRKLMESKPDQSFLLFPTENIYFLWREHLLRPRSYSEMCMNLLGDSRVLAELDEEGYNAIHLYDYEKEKEMLTRTLRYMCLMSDDLADLCVAGFKQRLGGAEWITKRQIYYENLLYQDQSVSLQFKLHNMEQVYTFENVPTKISFRELHHRILDLLYPANDASTTRPTLSNTSINHMFKILINGSKMFLH